MKSNYDSISLDWAVYASNLINEFICIRFYSTALLSKLVYTLFPYIKLLYFQNKIFINQQAYIYIIEVTSVFNIKLGDMSKISCSKPVLAYGLPLDIKFFLILSNIKLQLYIINVWFGFMVKLLFLCCHGNPKTNAKLVVRPTCLGKQRDKTNLSLYICSYVRSENIIAIAINIKNLHKTSIRLLRTFWLI